MKLLSWKVNSVLSKCELFPSIPFYYDGSFLRTFRVKKYHILVPNGFFEQPARQKKGSFSLLLLSLPLPLILSPLYKLWHYFHSENYTQSFDFLLLLHGSGLRSQLYKIATYSDQLTFYFMLCCVLFYLKGRYFIFHHNRHHCIPQCTLRHLQCSILIRLY